MCVCGYIYTYLCLFLSHRMLTSSEFRRPSAISISHHLGAMSPHDSGEVAGTQRGLRLRLGELVHVHQWRSLALERSIAGEKS